MTAAEMFQRYTDTNGETPINRLYRRIANATADAQRWDTWTRDAANNDSPEWEYRYRQMRAARNTIRRCEVAIRRIDAAMGH